MQIRLYSSGKFYLIQCPDGALVLRSTLPSVLGALGSHDVLVVPFKGEEIKIPSDLPELLPLLAESGRFGVSLFGEPVPDVNLAGAGCPNCNEDDVSWLSVDDGSKLAHCDYYGCDFGLGCEL
jgi:hypothetical protein